MKQKTINEYELLQIIPDKLIKNAYFCKLIKNI